MEYYGKIKTKTVETRQCEYIRCDECHDKIDKVGSNYYLITIRNRYDSEDFEICQNCLEDFILNKLKEFDEFDISIEIQKCSFDNNEYHNDIFCSHLVENDPYNVKEKKC